MLSFNPYTVQSFRIDHQHLVQALRKDQLSKTTLIITAEDLAEHFRQVEAFINYEDSTTTIREQLFKEIEQAGLDSLTLPQ